MKKLIQCFVFLILSTTIYSAPINWKTEASLYDHLIEVNKEWLSISASELLCEEMVFENDRNRIQMHLKLVEHYLRQNPPKGLNKFQLENRNVALNILKDYWEAGIFPQNTRHTERQPYFIDDYGTACAVGFLALKTGETELVHNISKEMNFAYIDEIQKHYPQLLDWAKEYGFTMQELAWIQPGYPPMNQTWNPIGNGGACDGEIKTMKAFGDEMLYFGGDFSEIDGFAANSIVGWDGNNWHTLGEGVNGIVNDISIDNDGRVFIGGDFTVNGDPSIVNVAYWYNGQWFGYNTENMAKEVFAVHATNGILYVGGSFELVYPNQTIKYLASVNIDEFDLENQNGDLSVNTSVYDITDDGNDIIVAGKFVLTATQSANSEINQLQTKYLATWGFDEAIGSNNWLEAFDHELDTSIYRIFFSNESIYAGLTERVYSLGFGVYNNSTWGYHNMSNLNPSNSNFDFVKGFTKHNDFVIMYGNIAFNPIVGVWSRGIYVINATNSLLSEGATFDASVNAAESFQEKIYFAGDFTSVQGQEFPGLVSSPFDGTVPIKDATALSDFKIFTSNSEIHVRHEALNEDLNFMVYNLSGQLISQSTLNSGTTSSNISTQSWPAGMYVYQLVGNGIQQSGKLAVF